MILFCFAQGLLGAFMVWANYPKTEKADRTCFYYWGTHCSIWFATATIIGALK